MATNSVLAWAVLITCLAAVVLPTAGKGPVLFPSVDEVKSLVYDQATNTLLPVQASFPKFLCSQSKKSVANDVKQHDCRGNVIYTTKGEFSLTLLYISDNGAIQPLPRTQISVNNGAKLEVSTFGQSGTLPHNPTPHKVPKGKDSSSPKTGRRLLQGTGEPSEEIPDTTDDSSGDGKESPGGQPEEDSSGDQEDSTSEDEENGDSDGEGDGDSDGGGGGDPEDEDKTEDASGEEGRGSNGNDSRSDVGKDGKSERGSRQSSKRGNRRDDDGVKAGSLARDTVVFGTVDVPKEEFVDPPSEEVSGSPEEFSADSPREDFKGLPWARFADAFLSSQDDDAAEAPTDEVVDVPEVDVPESKKRATAEPPDEAPANVPEAAAAGVFTEPPDAAPEIAVEIVEGGGKEKGKKKKKKNVVKEEDDDEEKAVKVAKGAGKKKKNVMKEDDMEGTVKVARGSQKKKRTTRIDDEEDVVKVAKGHGRKKKNPRDNDDMGDVSDGEDKDNVEEDDGNDAVAKGVKGKAGRKHKSGKLEGEEEEEKGSDERDVAEKEEGDATEEVVAEIEVEDSDGDEFVGIDEFVDGIMASFNEDGDEDKDKKRDKLESDEEEVVDEDDKEDAFETEEEEGVEVEEEEEEEEEEEGEYVIENEEGEEEEEEEEEYVFESDEEEEEEEEKVEEVDGDGDEEEEEEEKVFGFDREDADEEDEEESAESVIEVDDDGVEDASENVGSGRVRRDERFVVDDEEELDLVADDNAEDVFEDEGDNGREESDEVISDSQAGGTTGGVTQLSDEDTVDDLAEDDRVNSTADEKQVEHESQSFPLNEVARGSLAEGLTPGEASHRISYVVQIRLSDLAQNKVTTIRTSSNGESRVVHIFYDTMSPESHISIPRSQRRVKDGADKAEIKFEVLFSERVFPSQPLPQAECNLFKETYQDLLSLEALAHPETVVKLRGMPGITDKLVGTARKCGARNLLDFDPSDLFVMRGNFLEFETEFQAPSYKVRNLDKQQGKKALPKVIVKAKFDLNDTSSSINLRVRENSIRDYSQLLNTGGVVKKLNFESLLNFLDHSLILAKDVIEKGKNLGTAATTVTAATVVATTATTIGVSVAASAGGSGIGGAAAGGSIAGAVDMLNVGQKMFLTGQMAVDNMPENFKAFTDQLSWTVFDVKLPWEKSEDPDEPEEPQSRRKLLLELEDTYFLFTSDGDGPADHAKRAFFWIALILGVLTFAHLLMAIILMLIGIRIPKIFRFPRLELYFMYWAIPAIAIASAGLFKGRAEQKLLGAFLIVVFPLTFLIWHVYIIRKHFYLQEIPYATLVVRNKDGKSSASTSRDGEASSEEYYSQYGSEGSWAGCCYNFRATFSWIMEKLVLTPLLGAPYDEGTWVVPNGPTNLFVHRYGAMFEEFRHRPTVIKNATYSFNADNSKVDRGTVEAVPGQRGLENTSLGHAIQIGGKALEVFKLVFIAILISGEDDPSSTAQAIVLLAVTVIYAIVLRVFRPQISRWDLGVAMVGEVCDIFTYIIAILILKNGGSDEPLYMERMGIALLCFQGVSFLTNFLDHFLTLVEAVKGGVKELRDRGKGTPRLVDVMMMAQLHNPRYLQRKYFNRWCANSLGVNFRLRAARRGGTPLEENFFQGIAKGASWRKLATKSSRSLKSLNSFKSFKST